MSKPDYRRLPQRDERAHPVIEDAIRKGHVDTGKNYVIPGFPTREIANEARKSVYNASRHLGVSCSSRTGEDILDAGDGTFTVQFRLWSKNHGRRHIVKTTGGDPSRLAYNPFERKKGPIVDDSGNLMALRVSSE